MITAAQIRSMIHQLTLSKVSLDDFEEWFTAASWNAHQDSDIEAMKLVGEIELDLAEMDTGHKSYGEVLNDLSRLAGIFEMGEVQTKMATSSTVKTFPFSLQFEPSADADKQHGMEFSYTPLLPA